MWNFLDFQIKFQDKGEKSVSNTNLQGMQYLQCQVSKELKFEPIQNRSSRRAKTVILGRCRYYVLLF
jgi:hypothetical protein